MTNETNVLEPIAIVGIGCRFPGGANDPENFWDLLINGVDAVRTIPSDRWEVEAFYDPDPSKEGKMYTKYGGFLESVDKFDPEFFGIAPREAKRIDPQQRLFLEVSWEALENAGQSPDQLYETKTGVFAGVSNHDYYTLLLKNGPSEIDAYYGTGTQFSVLPGRLSYLLGLQGPSFAVDTAFSASMVAVHLACQSLRGRECNLAIAGGVNLILSPENTINFCKASMLSPDGRCKTFDASADGYGRGEGCGVIVLKRLSDARLNGDNILAVIRASGINQDGRSAGLTAPNRISQENLLKETLRKAGVSPEEVTYIECHGTGTKLGDPIEVHALKTVFGDSHSPENPLYLSSVKANIGHLEAAAGISGLIKVVLLMQHRQIPPHLHLKQLNPHMDIDQESFIIPSTPLSWHPKNRHRIAGVSSFGFNGTNAFAVLEEAPTPSPKPIQPERSHHIFTLSAKSETALNELVQRYKTFMQTHPDESLPDICFTANAGRAELSHRLALVVANAQELREQLNAVSNQSQSQKVFRGMVREGETPKVAFYLPAELELYPGMARGLYESQAVFRETLESCDQLLRSELNFSIVDLLYNQSEKRSLPSTARLPINFAIEYALARLWISWGIEPALLVGHGIGEYVAACLSGIWSLEDGLRVVKALTVEGEGDSGQKSSMKEVLKGVRFSSPQIEIIARRGEKTVNEESLSQVSYWLNPAQDLSPSNFPASIVKEQNCQAAIEMGAGLGDWKQVLEGLAELYVRGARIDWVAFDKGYPRRRIVLPTYPFQRKSYWIEFKEKAPAASGPLPPAKSTSSLLGQRLRSSLMEDLLYETILSTESHPFLKDHQYTGTVLVSASAMISMLLSAVRENLGEVSYEIKDMLLLRPLVIPKDQGQLVQLILKSDVSKGYSFQVQSLSQAEEDGSDEWVTYASGSIALIDGHQKISQAQTISLSKLKNQLTEKISSRAVYEGIQSRGMQLANTYCNIEEARRNQEQAITQIQISPNEDQKGFALNFHPGLVDSCFQSLMMLIPPEASPSDPFVLSGFASFRFYSPGSDKITCYAKRRSDPGQVNVLEADLYIYDHNQNLIAEVQGAQLNQIKRENFQKSLLPVTPKDFYELKWLDKALPDAVRDSDKNQPRKWLILADQAGMGEALAENFKSQGDDPILVFAANGSTGRGDNGKVIDPARKQEYQQLAEQLLSDSSMNLGGIINFWPLDSSSPEKSTLTSLTEDQVRSCQSTLYLAQAFGKDLIPLYLVTAGVQSLEKEEKPIAFAQAPIWGLARTISFEYPDLKKINIDLDPSEPAGPSAQKVYQEIRADDQEDQVVYRHGKRYVPRLVGLDLSGIPAHPNFRDNGSYLIVGGFGALGLYLAEWLVSKGVKHLVLADLLPPSEAIEKRLGLLRDKGVSILTAQANVAVGENVKKLFLEIEGKMPTLSGIFQCAAAIDDDPLPKQSWERFTKVMAPKIQGTWNLYQECKTRPLDFLVVFSSIASLFGSPNQGNYAAANAFQDAFVHFLRQQGLPALDIHWAPWSIGVGKAMGDRAAAVWKSWGMRMLTPEKDLDKLSQILTSGKVEIGVFPIKWDKYIRQYENVPPFLREIASQTAEASKVESAEPDLLNLLNSSLPEERGQKIKEYVETQIKSVLSLPEEHDLDDQESFNEMGFDSLMLVELRNRLERSIGQALPVTMGFRYPNSDRLSAYIDDLLMGKEKSE